MDANERRELIAQARFGRKNGVTAKHGLAITSHPIATRAAVDVLKSGGNACDAALSASITQTVVEPHMTTITGVLSMLYYDAGTGQVSHMNGGMNTPKAPLPGFSAADLAIGRGVPVPGFWAGFEAALERFGTKPKAELMRPAITLAREGFEIHPFLYGYMFEQVACIGRSAQGREMFMPEGALLSPGELLIQTRAAETLERLAEEGNDYFYRGEFAEKLCHTVQRAGGVLTREDLEAYQVRWQEPARGTYRGYEVVGSPPPDNGGTHVIEALNMIELLDLQKLGAPTESAETLYHLMAIHNEVYYGGARQPDPESHPLPLETILSKEYAAIRFKLLQMTSPRQLDGGVYPGSNHVTVVDQAGNIATVLHSCMGMPWNNGLFVDGISVSAGGGHFLRNMPRPGKRASAMIVPTIVFKEGQPVLACGSPSTGLIANVLQNLVNVLDFGLTLTESVHLPRFGGPFVGGQGLITQSIAVEADIDERLRNSVAARGIRVEVVNPWSQQCGSFEGIYINQTKGTLSACADPRRAGFAEGVGTIV